jgi:hypothetical protein
MAVNRNLQFYGFAYGDTPVTLDVKINGQQVFLNTVSTIPGEVPTNTFGMVLDQVLFEVNDTDLFPITFGGSYSHSIEVSGGSGIYIGSVRSNCTDDRIDDPGDTITFVNVYYGNPINSEGTPDVRSSVYIDREQQVPPCAVSRGTWHWVVKTGSNLSCNLNISTGNIG